jgi:hypothetical protein
MSTGVSEERVDNESSITSGIDGTALTGTVARWSIASSSPLSRRRESPSVQRQGVVGRAAAFAW